jgi:hypothetical protein
MPHAPGGELVGEELRRHRRLAVGRERDAVLVAEAPHAREVVAQAVAAQRQRGEQEVAGPQRQPELADAAERHVGQRVRQPLGADADGLGQQRVEAAHRRAAEHLVEHELVVRVAPVGAHLLRHADRPREHRRRELPQHRR